MIEIAPMIILPDFSTHEFNCKCCKLNNMKPIFLWKLQQARTEAQVKFVVVSGTRCEKHNKAVGGKEYSEHLTGEAADILTSNSYIRFKILKAAFSIGFMRIGIGPNFIHLGDRPSYAQQIVWTYY